jgi:hypothetical protein
VVLACRLVVLACRLVVRSHAWLARETAAGAARQPLQPQLSRTEEAPEITW